MSADVSHPLLLRLAAGLHNDLGKAYALGGQLDAAIAQFRAALTIQPLPESRANLERALADRSRSGAR